MIRLTQRSTRTYTLCPYTTLFRSPCFATLPRKGAQAIVGDEYSERPIGFEEGGKRPQIEQPTDFLWAVVVYELAANPKQCRSILDQHSEGLRAPIKIMPMFDVYPTKRALKVVPYKLDTFVAHFGFLEPWYDRKSKRLNSSH